MTDVERNKIKTYIWNMNLVAYFGDLYNPSSDLSKTIGIRHLLSPNWEFPLIPKRYLSKQTGQCGLPDSVIQFSVHSNSAVWDFEVFIFVR